MTEHPITPPPKLVEKWIKSARYREFMPYPEGYEQYEQRLTTIAARWGADQELEACLDEIYKGVGLRIIDHGSHRELLCSDLRAARRPKPPSLKERALSEVAAAIAGGNITPKRGATIRLALEQLDD